MSKFTIGIAVVVLATALSAAAYAAPPETEAPKKAAPQHAAPQERLRHSAQRAAVHTVRAAAGSCATCGSTEGGGATTLLRKGRLRHAAAQRNTGARPAITRNAPTSTVGSRALTNRNATRSTTRTATFNTRLNSTVKANAVRER